MCRRGEYELNIGVIFAGGTGSRMNSKKAVPKQFLSMHGKPIIVHTLEIFQNHPEIDLITVSCVVSGITQLEELVQYYHLTKVKAIVEGGDTGQKSIYFALRAAEEFVGKERAIVLIHDGVRPLITAETISNNIASVKKYGSCITTVPVTETIIEISDDKSIKYIPDRNHSRLARAPQSFWLDEVLKVHRLAIQEGKNDFIDSCTMMQHYGKKMYLVDGPKENIKVTTPDDFITMRALLDAKENEQLYGLED